MGHAYCKVCRQLRLNTSFSRADALTLSSFGTGSLQGEQFPPDVSQNSYF